jgi:WD repeat-containing protein 35
VLDAREIYSLIALASYYSKFFAVCSTAFCRLESLTTLSSAEREEVGELALQIFTKHKPVNAASVRGGPDGSYAADCRCEQCGSNSVQPWDTSCDNCGTKFKPCVVTGASLVWPEARDADERPAVYTCKTCRHDALTDELRGFNNCPLCHAMLDEKQLGAADQHAQMLFNKGDRY